MANEMLGFGLIATLVLLIVLLGIAALVFWIWSIIDCAKRKFKNSTEQIVWILVIVFLGVLGSIIYYFAVKRR